MLTPLTPKTAYRCPVCGGTYQYYRPLVCSGLYSAGHDPALMGVTVGPVEDMPLIVSTPAGGAS